MVEKRANEGSGDDVGADPSKKPRTDAPAAPAAAAKPSLSLAALEKAKKALQLQKELKEKLKNIPQLQKPAAAAAGVAGTNVLAAAQKAAQIAAQIAQGPVVAPPVLQQAAAVGVPVALAPFTAAPSYKVAPLRLDSQGREVDEFGNPIQRAVQVVSTLKVNQQHAAQAAAAAAKPKFLDLDEAPPEQQDSEFFDPRMAGGGKRVDRRRRSGFDFVQEGQFQKQAEIHRLKSHFGDGAARKTGIALPKGPIGPSLNPNLVSLGGAPPPEGMDPNLVPIAPRVFSVPDEDDEEAGAAKKGEGGEEAEAEEVVEPPEPVPAVEWWDRHILATGSYENDIGPGDNGEEGAGEVAIKESKITRYIEHPVPIEPPAEAPPPPPQPLKLTKKELKKLRTQRRQAREKEKQELIRQGLLEPPKPKVKIANLYRVLGEQAVADPTAMEKEARRQMAERQNAHDDRNMARMLTPEERREKKMRKLFDESEVDLVAAVYKVVRMNGQQRFKVDINAKENHLKGAAMMTPDFCLVCVEGCNKSIKRYNKLMLRRIDWTSDADNKRDADGMEVDTDGDGDDEKEDLAPNSCDLVWQGVLKQSHFNDFRVYADASVEQACAVLEKHRVRQYWDVALNFVPGDAPPVEL